MEQVLYREPGQEPVGFPRRSAGKIVLGFAPSVEITSPPLSIDVGRPGDSEGVHPVFVLEDVRGIVTVFAPTAGDDAVVEAGARAVLRAQFAELFLALSPIRFRLSLRYATGIANPFLVKVYRFLGALRVVRVLYRRVGPLVRDGAFTAELYL